VVDLSFLLMVSCLVCRSSASFWQQHATHFIIYTLGRCHAAD
jgi:hypothetical protein